jgi:hypothetical protein
MVLDAQIILTVRRKNNVATSKEMLYPPRHQITLPLNNLNFLFENITVAFNQTNKYSSDK